MQIKKPNQNDNNLKDNKMTKKRRHPKEREKNKQIVRVTKLRLGIIIAFLSLIVILLIFKVGEVLWPVWMIDYRNLIIGIILIPVILITLMSPVIIEVNSNPRVLSGPGKDPRQHWDP